VALGRVAPYVFDGQVEDQQQDDDDGHRGGGWDDMDVDSGGAHEEGGRHTQHTTRPNARRHHTAMRVCVCVRVCVYLTGEDAPAEEDNQDGGGDGNASP